VARRSSRAARSLKRAAAWTRSDQAPGSLR
jgi:hypothetical protein